MKFAVNTAKTILTPLAGNDPLIRSKRGCVEQHSKREPTSPKRNPKKHPKNAPRLQSENRAEGR